jgi:hypothetical protein
MRYFVELKEKKNRTQRAEIQPEQTKTGEFAGSIQKYSDNELCAACQASAVSSQLLHKNASK